MCCVQRGGGRHDCRRSRHRCARCPGIPLAMHVAAGASSWEMRLGREPGACTCGSKQSRERGRCVKSGRPAERAARCETATQPRPGDSGLCRRRPSQEPRVKSAVRSRQHIDGSRGGAAGAARCQLSGAWDAQHGTAQHSTAQHGTATPGRRTLLVMRPLSPDGKTLA